MERPPFAVVDAYVDLTGKVTKGVAFSGCVVELRDGPKSEVKFCTFEDCQFVGDGWPVPVFEVRLR